MCDQSNIYDLGEGIRLRIEGLANADEKKECLRRFEDAVCEMSVEGGPWESKYRMFRTLEDLLATVWLKGCTQEYVWKNRIRFLSRWRREVAIAGPRIMTDERRALEITPRVREAMAHDGFVETMTRELEARYRFDERSIVRGNGRGNAAEHARIRMAYEKFLGRPLKTPEQIREEDRRREEEWERKLDPGPPDVKVELDL